MQADMDQVITIIIVRLSQILIDGIVQIIRIYGEISQIHQWLDSDHVQQDIMCRAIQSGSEYMISGMMQVV